jgi:TonB-dependent receptor
LDFIVVAGDEVVVTGQAEAQMAAINQQLSARSIKNVVSAKRIQEIPDANAAEAVGRLPGVSLVRSGGEGSKVVIRGLSPKYNKIQVEGVKMAATGSDDRSSDLSMISPYMLEGIEVSKAALPDKEADVIGGSVNFILREAPEGLKYDALVQSSYNGLKKDYGDYKFVLSGSNRFFDNKLGIFAQLDVENRNRSSYELNVNYTNFSSPLNPDDVDVSISTLLLKDISRDINRYGGTIVMDYKLPNGKIKLSNFISSIAKNYLNRFENYRPFYVDLFYTLQDAENDLTVMTNSLRIQNSFSGLNIDAGISYAYSKNESPRSVTFQGYEPSAFDVKKLNYEAPPDSIPYYVNNNIASAYLYDVTLATSITHESEISVDINIDYTLNISKGISALLKAGTKYKYLEKDFDKEVEWMPIHWGGGEPSKRIDKILQAYPWMQETAPLGSIRLPYSLFIDPDYHPEDFLGGNYTIQNMPNPELANGIADLLKGDYFYNYPQSIKDDYNGNENYFASYVMSDINIGNMLTIIPGVRYERNETQYTGIRGNQQTKLEHIGYIHYDTTTTRKNDFLLPMVHVKFKPVKWFDIRAAYTNTLSRPNYNHIIPSWNRTLTNVVWNNPFLKPSQSTNIDLYASFYSNEVGLFTIGGFYKEIKDLIFWAGIGSITDPNEYGLPAITAGKTISKMINNKFPAFLRGIELEWQTHFWYLPGILKGLVFNINYTHTSSSVKYPRTIIKTKYLNKPPWVIVTNIDTFFTDRLINQPNNILNITLGFDYKGFSTRVSMLFQDDIFAKSNFWERHRGTSAQYTRWDIAVRQKLPIEGLELLGNFNNITATIERDVNVGTGYPIREQHYGSTIDVGIRYRLQ